MPSPTKQTNNSGTPPTKKVKKRTTTTTAGAKKGSSTDGSTARKKTKKTISKKKINIPVPARYLSSSINNMTNYAKPAAAPEPPRVKSPFEPTGKDRIWVLPSQEAWLTVIVCRFVLFLCLCCWVTIRYYWFPKPKKGDDAEEELDEMIVEFITNSKWILGCIAFFFGSILYGCQGPRWSLWYRILGMGPVPTMFYRRTFVAPGYDDVVQAFASTLAEGRETSMQLAIYVKGRLVVDLAGSSVQKVNRYSHYGLDYDNPLQLKYDSNIYSTVWSSSKVITSVLMAWLVDKGHLDYKAKIVQYWPEFTGGGKENITVEQLLKHNAGLHTPPWGEMKMEDLFTENIPNGNASKVLESLECWFPPKWSNWLTYHGITRGWICNEIARRVDPKKRTLGTILREEFTEELGIQDECYLGLPKKLCAKTNPYIRDLDPVPYFFWVICNKLCQYLLLPCTVYWHFFLAQTGVVTFGTLHWTRVTTFFNPQRYGKHEFAKQADYKRGESPAANIQATARAMAAIVNAMSIRDPRIFTKDPNDKLYQKFSANPETRYLMPMPPPIFSEGKLLPMAKVTFGDGGFCVMSRYGDPTNVQTHIPSMPGIPYGLGWFGFNGSVTAFHPKGDYAICFQPTSFNDLDPVTRIGKMTNAFMDCAKRIHGDDFGKIVDE